MSIYKKFIILSLLALLSSCGVVKEGFSNQKKNSSDEFLVEKKSPLIMPPDYNELPIPKINETKNEENQIKELIEKGNKENNLDSQKEIDKSFENILIEKLKNN
jgi:hypothetical protein